MVYTDFLNKVTCVKYAPNGNFLASGDDKGKVKIFSYNEGTKEFVAKKEHSMLMGAVKDIAFTDDSARLCGVGEGKDYFAKAIIADSGNKLGDLFGPTKNLLAVDIKKKPYRMALAGEESDIFIFDGVPFKTVKTLHPHSSFIN